MVNHFNRAPDVAESSWILYQNSLLLYGRIFILSILVFRIRTCLLMWYNLFSRLYANVQLCEPTIHSVTPQFSNRIFKIFGIVTLKILTSQPAFNNNKTQIHNRNFHKIYHWIKIHFLAYITCKTRTWKQSHNFKTVYSNLKLYRV